MQQPPGVWIEPIHCSTPAVVEELHSSVILQTSPQSGISKELRKEPSQLYRTRV